MKNEWNNNFTHFYINNILFVIRSASHKEQYFVSQHYDYYFINLGFMPNQYHVIYLSKEEVEKYSKKIINLMALI